MADDTGAEWGSIAEAARRLGIARQSVQRRVARGTLETKREMVGNKQRVLVRLPPPVPPPLPQPVPQPEQAELIAELRATIADLRGERDRLLAVIERLSGERRPWWRRWWRH